MSASALVSSVREVFDDALDEAGLAFGDFFLPDRRLELLLVNSESSGPILIAEVAMVESSDDISSTIRSRSSPTILRSCALDSVTRA